MRRKLVMLLRSVSVRRAVRQAIRGSSAAEVEEVQVQRLLQVHRWQVVLESLIPHARRRCRRRHRKSVQGFVAGEDVVRVHCRREVHRLFLHPVLSRQ